MNDSDIEVILALAQGTLSGEAEKRARERVASHPELARELAAQIAVIEALDDLPAATLRAEERSTLRSSLVTQLHLEPAPTPTPAPRHPSRWWKPVVGLAAVAAVAVAFVAVPGLLSGNNAAQDVALVATDSGGTEGATNLTDSGEVGTAESAPSVTSAPAGDLGVEFLTLTEIPTSEVGLLLTSLRELDTTNSDAQKFVEDDAARTTVDLAVLEDCIDRLGDALPDELTPLAATTTEGAQVVHLGAGAEGAVTSVVSIDLDTCQISATNP